MPDQQSDGTTGTGSVDSLGELAATASSTFKVKGEFSADDGAGVLGINDAGSGMPIGVEGAVPSNTSSGYGLYTDHNARVGGTADVAMVRFDDTDADDDRLTLTEASDGNLEVSHGGSPTHEFASNGDTNITGTFTENASL